MNKILYSKIASLIIIYLSACASPTSPVSAPNTSPDSYFEATPIASPGANTDTPLPTSVDQLPPPATLTINGIAQTSGVGTYCWNTQTATGESVDACADMIGVPTASEPLKASSPVKGQLTLPLSDPPNQLILTAYHALPALELPDKAGGYRWWSFTEGYISPLPLQASQDVNIKLDRGLYVLYVFAVWDDKGDVSYGFLVDVK